MSRLLRTRDTQRRMLAVAVTWLCFAASRALVPEPVARADLQYLAVTTLGYGHLLGAIVFARRRAGAAPARARGFGFGGSVAVGACLAAFCIYTELLRAAPWLPILLLMVSIWHGLENDRALARAQGHPLRLEAVRASPRELGRDLALTLALGVLALLTTPLSERVALLPSPALLRLDLSEWISFADLFTLSTGYHIVSWLLFFAERRRALLDAGDGVAARALAIRLAVVHAPPLALCLALSAQGGPGALGGRAFLFSPAVYLFWSAVHAGQTAQARRRDAPRAPGAIAAVPPPDLSAYAG
jgi:hypothetical protein